MSYARPERALRPRLQMLLIALSLACCLFLGVPGIAALQPLHVSAQSSQQMIVVLKQVPAGQSTLAASAVLDQFAAQGLRDLEPVELDSPVAGEAVYLADVAADADVAALAANLVRSPLVARAESNAPRRFMAINASAGPLDVEYGLQPYYVDIGVVAMWARGLTGSSAANPVTVAVIDTGVDLDHPDIDANLVPGFDFVDLDAAPQDVSTNSHGSAVAGIIGAEINNDLVDGYARGVAGIGGGDALAGTPGLRIMPLRVVASQSGNIDCVRVAEAIDYARKQGAQVINMSLGGEEPCDLERKAVQRAYDAGIALVAAAGNGNSTTPIYPAAYGAGTNDQLVIAVTGLDPDGRKAARSSYGPWVDIAAPFQSIYSLTNNGGYSARSGTSFSAPFVSGLIGVLMSNYGWSRDQAIERMLTTADNVDALNPDYQGQLGAGRLNADLASGDYAPMTIHDMYLPIVRGE